MRQFIITFSVIIFLPMLVAVTTASHANALTSEEIEHLSHTVVFGKTEAKIEALNKFKARGNADIVPGLILGFRYRQNDQAILKLISHLTGSDIKNWRDALLWQEAHPEIKAHPSYQKLKLAIYDRIDPRFKRFLGGDKSLPENMKIRLEEVVWGGVPADGIPSLDNPDLIDANDASYMIDSDLVFGVEINGDVRAYPLRIMGWHEMFNEVIGGVPVALAYCTLCGAGILFETKIKGRDKPLIFGSSGLLYRSNKLMFDRKSGSLWNQFTGEPVSGPLLNSGIQLKIRPVTITSWGKWRARHPDSKVLSIETGHARDYGSGVVYKDYFASPDLMFPVLVRGDAPLEQKDYVFGIREFGAAKAWPVTAFTKTSVINDQIGAKKIVLIGDAASRTVRAYQRGDRSFKPLTNDGVLSDSSGNWKITETALVGPQGQKQPRVPGHISYWFAWDSYLGVESELYSVN